MCAGHITDELVAAMLGLRQHAAVFRDGIMFLLASHDGRTRSGTARWGDSGSAWLSSGPAPKAITYERE